MLSHAARALRRAHVLIALLSVVVLGGFDCGPPINQDPGFDIWCGNKLCAWDVEAGQIRRVATWHRSDYGVELVGDKVALSQLVTSGPVGCLKFSLQAQKHADASLRLELDFQADGTVEYSDPILSENFARTDYRITPPVWYDTVRVRVTKTGPGRAVVARMRIDSSNGCTDPPIVMRDRKNGWRCSTDSECASGMCDKVVFSGSEKVCITCRDDKDCSAGQLCGPESDGAGRPYQACGAKGRHELAAPCLSDAECSSGVCCGNMCSDCCNDGRPCAGGETCSRVDWRSELGEEYALHRLPWQCAPGKGLAAAGAVCLRNEDCSSGSCKGNGPLQQCDITAARCTDKDQCALKLCLSIGVDGGTCAK